MILNFSLRRASDETIYKLVACTFCISESLAHEVIAWRSKAKSCSSSSLEMTKKSKNQEDSTLKLKKWEEIAYGSNHNYADDIFMALLDEEANQETT